MGEGLLQTFMFPCPTLCENHGSTVFPHNPPSPSLTSPCAGKERGSSVSAPTFPGEWVPAPVSNPFFYTAMLPAEKQQGQGWCLTSVIPVLTLRQENQEVKVIQSELSAPPWSEGRKVL